MSAATALTLAGTLTSTAVGVSTLAYNMIRIRRTLETHLESQDQHLASQDAKLHAITKIVAPPQEDEDE